MLHQLYVHSAPYVDISPLGAIVVSAEILVFNDVALAEELCRIVRLCESHARSLAPVPRFEVEIPAGDVDVACLQVEGWVAVLVEQIGHVVALLEEHVERNGLCVFDAMLIYDFRQDVGLHGCQDEDDECSERHYDLGELSMSWANILGIRFEHQCSMLIYTQLDLRLSFKTQQFPVSCCV